MSWARMLATHKPVAKRGSEERFIPKASLDDFNEPNAEVAREIKRRNRKRV